MNPVAFALILWLYPGPLEADPLVVSVYPFEDMCNTAKEQMKWFTKDGVQMACQKLPSNASIANRLQ